MGLSDDARARLRADPAGAWLALFVLVDVALVWSLPVLVGQDVPQHLAYGRILADYTDPALPFRDTFLLPTHPQAYFTVHLALAALSRVTSILTACRLLYTAYVVAMAATFRSLVRAVHAPRFDDGTTPWTALFGPLLVWNPVQCVGFLPFMLALPALLSGAAAAVRLAEAPTRRRMAWLVVATAVTASLHLVAGAALLAFAGFHALARRTRGAFIGGALTLGALLATIAVFRLVGQRELKGLPQGALEEGIAAHGLWDGVVWTLGVHWSTFATRWSFVVATVLGPLPRMGKDAVAIAMLVLGAFVFQARHRSPERPAARLPYALAVVAFTLLVVATPSSLVLPEDICLLDFRLYVVAFLLGVAWLPPGAFEPRRAHVALVAFAVFILSVWSRALGGAAHEAEAVLHLVNEVGPHDTVLALPFHDRSEYLDETNSVTHYLPVYATSLRGSVTSLFWGKFSEHLPVGYRPGREPKRPPDWDPTQFTDEQLALASHVLVEWPDDDDGAYRTAAATHLKETLDVSFTTVACEGRWCLYRAGAPETPVREEALR